MKSLVFGLLTFAIFFSCKPSEEGVIITVSNPLDFQRKEVIEIATYKFDIEFFSTENQLQITEVDSKQTVPHQLEDMDNDGVVDQLLFWVELDGKEEKSYLLKSVKTPSEFESKIFARFVPERTDDFAWENDKVAFRTYGPTAQKMIEEGIPGGTLSSGIDCWLKKVDYPIIDKWYEKHLSGAGSYHEDTGEGLDNFHVGSSRGCGGLGVFKNNNLYTSDNFTNWKIYENGPLRTRFSLNYEDWMAGNVQVSEVKNISLDLGSYLMKVEAGIQGVETITVGLTLHENDGEITVDKERGIFSYWQPHGDSELGTAIVCDPDNVIGYTELVSKEKDKSHLLVHIKVNEGIAEYYTGFGWKESAQFENKKDWDATLSRTSESLKYPIETIIERN